VVTIQQKLEKRYEPVTETGCWLWTGVTMWQGYPVLAIGSRKLGTRKQVRAHRLSYEIYNGPIPSGMYVCHKCDVPICINPNHLFLGTAADNIRDMMAKGRWGGNQNTDKLYCVNGHRLEGENVYHYKGRRKCRECGRILAAQYAKRKSLIRTYRP
jgi:hypothetical protein